MSPKVLLLLLKLEEKLFWNAQALAPAEDQITTQASAPTLVYRTKAAVGSSMERKSNKTPAGTPLALMSHRSGGSLLPSQQTVSIYPSRCVNWGYIQFWRATLVNMLVITVNLITNQVSSKWWVFPWKWCHPWNFIMALGESAWAAAYQSGHWGRSCWSWPRRTSPRRSSRPGDLYSSQQHWWSKIGVGLLMMLMWLVLKAHLFKV